MSIKNKINKSLPKEQRLGQIGVNTKGEEMIISEYNNSTNIVITFTHNMIDIKTTYALFTVGNIKNPKYYKEQREGQIRKANNGQWMRLLIYNDSRNCVVEFEDGTLVDCRYECFDNGGVTNPNCILHNQFYYNDKLNCWVGITNKGDKFLFSHPDEEVVEYIKKCTWNYNEKTNRLSNYKKETIQQILMPITKQIMQNGYDRITYKNNNELDFRYDNLKYSNAKVSSLNIKKTNNKTGITGLIHRSNNTWNCQFKGVCTPCRRNKDQALKDTIIIQKHYNAMHNYKIWHIIDDVDETYKRNLIKEFDFKMEKSKNRKDIVNCHNEFIIDNNICKVKIKNDIYAYIDVEDIKYVEKGNWNCSSNNAYVTGSILINDKVKSTRLHKYVMRLIDDKYSNFVVDHIDGNKLNNTKNNLIITDYQGNNLNKKYKGYSKVGSSYITEIKLSKTRIARFRSMDKNEVLNFYNKYKQILLRDRICWNTKEELDEWLERIDNIRLTPKQAIENYYKELYSKLEKQIISEYNKVKIYEY